MDVCTSPKPAAFPPGPRGLRALGLVGLVRRDRIRAVDVLLRDYGKVAQFELGPVRLVLVGDARLADVILRDSHNFAEKGIGLREARFFLGRGLLTAAGADWSSARRVLNGLFRGDRIGSLLATTDAALGAELDCIARLVRSGEVVDIQPATARVALRTVAAALFAEQWDAPLDDVLHDFQTLGRWVERRFIMPLDWAARHSRGSCRPERAPQARGCVADGPAPLNRGGSGARCRKATAGLRRLIMS